MSLKPENKTKAELIKEIRSLSRKLNMLAKAKVKSGAAQQPCNTFEILSTLFDQSPLASVIIGKDGKFQYANPKLTKLLGYTLNDVPDIETWSKKVYPDKKYREKVMQEWADDIKKSRKEIISPKTFKLRAKDKTIKDIKFTVIFEENGSKIIFLEDMTAILRYENLLSDSEQKLREIFNHSNDSIYLWDYHKNKLGKLLEANDHAIELLGYSRSQFLQFTPFDILAPEYHSQAKEFLRNQQSDIKGYFEGEHISKKGKRIPVEISARVFKLNNRNVILSISRDITERKITQQQILESEEKFRTIVENSLTGIMIVDDKFAIIYANKEFSKITKYDPSELIGMDFRVFLESEYQTAIVERYKRRQKGEKVPNHYELKIVRKDGEIRWVDLSAGVITVINGRPNTITQIIDITESKNSVIALRSSEEKFRMVMEQSPVPIQMFTLDGAILTANNAWYRLWTIKKNEHNNTQFNILEDIQAANNGICEAFRNALNGHAIDIPELLYNPAKSGLPGRERFLHSKVYPLKDNSGIVSFIVMIHEDITEKKKTEAALIASEDRYRSLYENATVGIFSATLDCDFIMANPALLKMLGFKSFEELKLSHNQDNCLFEKNTMAYLQKVLLAVGEIHGWETLLRTKKGDSIFVLLNAKVIRNKMRKVEYFEGIVEDITDRKIAEKAIIAAKEEAEKSDRLKSEFLAQISHEIRTPINTILSFSGLISEELDDVIPDDLRPSFGIMSNAGRRMIRTIDLILNMSEVQTGTYKPLHKEIDLFEDILHNIFLEYLPAAQEKEINLKLIKDDDTPIIIADEYTVGQIFDNLVNNAIKYTHRGYVVIKLARQDNNQVYIEISDTGIGISEEYFPNLFQPFSQEDQGYTRKFEGNGLGLALVKKYCELNHADIFVESEKGEGTTFRIIFEKYEVVRKKQLGM